MLDYSLTIEEREKFILDFDVLEGEIKITYADKTTEFIELSEQNYEKISKIIENQINRAIADNRFKDYNDFFKLINFSKKRKLNDLEKNKFYLENKEVFDKYFHRHLYIFNLMSSKGINAIISYFNSTKDFEEQTYTSNFPYTLIDKLSYSDLLILRYNICTNCPTNINCIYTYQR